MRNFMKTSLVLAAGLSISACGGLSLGDRDRPDEFAVQRQAPLVVPPDFELVPPAPGAPRPTDGTAAQQALDALFPPAERSAVETSAINAAGRSIPGIRTMVGDEDTHVVDKGEATRTILAAPEGDGQAARSVIPS